MTEEKRLDDETLENVSGGQGESLNMSKVHVFLSRNCFHCRHYEADCPYGKYKEPYKAFEALGSEPYAVCPYKEAKKR